MLRGGHRLFGNASSFFGKLNSVATLVSFGEKRCRKNPPLFARSHHDEADVLRCGYESGHFGKPQIIGWADRQLEACNTASDALIDLSLCREADPRFVVSNLQSLGANDPQFCIDLRFAFLGLAFSAKRITLEQAARSLYAMLLDINNEDLLDASQRNSIYRIDDGYDLASSGAYGTIAEVESDFIEFVTPYIARLNEHHAELVASGE